MFLENPTLSDVSQMLDNVINITGKSLRAICLDYFNDVNLYKNLKRLRENKMPRKNGLLYKKACGFYKYEGFEKENLLPMIARYICTQLAFLPNIKPTEFRPWYKKKNVHVHDLSTKMIFHDGVLLEKGWWNVSTIESRKKYLQYMKTAKYIFVDSPFNDGKLKLSIKTFNDLWGKRAPRLPDKKHSIKQWECLYYHWAKQKGGCENPIVKVFYQNGQHYFIIEEIRLSSQKHTKGMPHPFRFLVKFSNNFAVNFIGSISHVRFWRITDYRKSYWIDKSGTYNFVGPSLNNNRLLLQKATVGEKRGRWLPPNEAAKYWKNK